MYQKKFFFIFFTFLSAFCSAQIMDVETSATKTNINWKDKHYFHTIGATLLFDYFIPPAKQQYYIFENGNGYDTSVYYLHNWGFNLASVTYDARVNIVDFNDRMSISANVPVSLGFGPVEPGGLLSGAAPLLIDFNYGCHSTYNNIDRYGFHVGIGYDAMITPLIKTEDRDITRFWVAPMMRAGFKGPYKTRSCFFDLQMALPKTAFDSEDDKTFKHRVHVKAVVGILLQYD